ncbi:glycosyltransferase [Arvimicrobium flavum]|uniref:glycosyltransferase n=1 Tax=Arvimicrobium flavum TaxID=3393320 RepID=UPI00237B4433|nr:glycosyltransferase [Mesorhizobium shangrilense]
MLTVLIETKNSEEGLARTLASLVPGAVDGVIRDVIVCDCGSTDETHHVAEHAGCHFVTEGIADAVKQAKGDWLLILEPGARLSEGWIEPVVHHVSKSTIAAQFSRAKAARAPFLSRVFSRNRALANGLLIQRRQAAALAKSARDAESLASGLATKRLSAEIVPAQA